MNEATKNQVMQEAAEIEAAANNEPETEKEEPKKKDKKTKDKASTKADKVETLSFDENGKKVPEEYGEPTLIIVPVDKNNPHLKTVHVRINEYEWDVPRGTSVKVPKAVFDQLRYAGYF